jgi:predicted dehydrogenase
MSETLRVGIVGAGGMGARHAQKWAQVAGVTVAAIADTRADRAQALAERVGASAVPDTDALLGQRLDIVVVAVPTHEHRAVAEAAFAAGSHVFCEKPLALTVADCDRLIAAAERAQKRLGVGQVLRFFPEFAAAHRQVQAGAVGTPAAVRTRRSGTFPLSDTDWFHDPARSGGILLDLAIHDFDWLLWTFGPVVRVYARSLTAQRHDHLDAGLVTLRHASGVVSHVEVNWADPAGFSTAFEIAGDAGLLCHDSRRAASLAVHRPSGAIVPASPLGAVDDPYFNQVAAFAASVRDGGPLPVSGADGRAAVAVAVAAVESATTGKAMTL